MLDLKDLFRPKTNTILTVLMTKHVEACISKANRIFTVGQSGAGKGVVAEEVAKQLGWKFINADVLASVASIGRKVTDVFGDGSEDKLNQTLTEILQHQTTQENIVVTTDENVACDPKDREILKSEFTLYIEDDYSALKFRESTISKFTNNIFKKETKMRFQEKRVA